MKKKELQQTILAELTDECDDNYDRSSDTSYWTSYEDAFSLSTKQVNDAFISGVAKRYIRWSQNARSISAMQFFAKEGIPKSTFYEWMKRHKGLAMAHKHVLQVIASRLNEGAVFSDSGMRENAAAFMLPHYDSDYKAQVEWRAKIREANSGEASDFIVQIGEVPTSDMVPLKKVESTTLKKETFEILNDRVTDVD